MIQSVRLPPHHTAVVPVEIVDHRGTILLEPSANLVDVLHIEDSLLEVDRDGAAMVVVSNTSKISHLLKTGEELGIIQEVNLVNLSDLSVILKLKLCRVLIRQWTHQM